MVLLSVLSNILASLEPFVRGHRDIFTDDVLNQFLHGVKVKSDEDRINEVRNACHVTYSQSAALISN